MRSRIFMTIRSRDPRRMASKARRHHDVGGDPAVAAPIETIGGSDAHWQVEFTATLWALIGGENPVMTLDIMRRFVEDMSAEDYDGMAYYDRQTLAVTSAMVERGLLSWDDVEQRISEIRNRR